VRRSHEAASGTGNVEGRGPDEILHRLGPRRLVTCSERSTSIRADRGHEAIGGIE
jgi:hypothetical protein